MILFHLDVATFAGGYVGVDVFFVISGFLITRNILNEGEDFRFGTFYWRRARRLMPAVWATIAVTMLVSSVLMRPDALGATAWSAMATTFSVSNFYFWSQSGYWDTASALKPLLHTWSLGVEEQFYLVWPLLLFLLRPLHRKWQLTACFVLLFLTGTALSVWATRRFPSAAFYLMPFRVMEFAMGASLASAEIHFRYSLPRAVKEALPLTGIGLILWSAVAFTGNTAFPGIAVVLPCLGGALLIFSGPRTSVGVALSNPIATYLGRISYSLYLVHWPVVSLWKYVTLGELSAWTQILLGAVMLALAALLHHLVEKPFRYGSTPSPALIMGLAASFMLALPVTYLSRLAIERQVEPAVGANAAAAPQAVAWQEALDVSREQFYKERLRYACPVTIPACNEPAVGKLNILVVGDSHTDDGVNIMRAAFPDAHIIMGGRAACASFVGYEQWHDDKRLPDDENHRGCLWNIKRIYDNEELLERVDIIAFNFLAGQPWFDDVARMLDETLAALRKQTKARIVIFGTAPFFNPDLPEIVRARKLTPDDAVPEKFVEPLAWTSDQRLQEIADKHGATFISKIELLCPNRACKPFTPDWSSLISYDAHHLSLSASDALGLALRPRLLGLARKS